MNYERAPRYPMNINDAGLGVLPEGSTVKLVVAASRSDIDESVFARDGSRTFVATSRAATWMRLRGPIFRPEEVRWLHGWDQVPGWEELADAVEMTFRVGIPTMASVQKGEGR